LEARLSLVSGGKLQVRLEHPRPAVPRDSTTACIPPISRTQHTPGSTPPGLDVKVVEPDQIVMVVELSGPGSVAADRAVKPGLYAQAGIRYYLRIELSQHAPYALAYTLRGGRYELAHQFAPGEPLRLAEPFAIDIDLATLARRTRPPA
ncbi:MAG: Uma2 family endonuclease, partial [Egibacteraceae bacterium]